MTDWKEVAEARQHNLDDAIKFTKWVALVCIVVGFLAGWLTAGGRL
jgi:hypothetical protein